MNILLTNDDGVYAPGLAATEQALLRLGNVYTVAPASEQSGTSHSITFLMPLTFKRVSISEQFQPWAVDGSPADCVKLGIAEIVPERPDVIVSGINYGLNTGINILYSGTVSAATEGALYGIPSFALSVERGCTALLGRTAELAVNLVTKILRENETEPCLYNINIPLEALRQENPKVVFAEMDREHYWKTFEKRIDPMERDYYWLSGRPDPRQPKIVHKADGITDMQAIADGFVAVTPLLFDRTDHRRMAQMKVLDLND